MVEVAGKAAITGGFVSLIVIILDTEASTLPQESVAVHVSVTEPLHTPATLVEKVDVFEVPLIKQLPLNPLVKVTVQEAGIPPQFTVIDAKADIVGNVAGLNVINLDTGTRDLPQTSVAVHVSVTVPPQAEGVAVNVDGFEIPLIKHPPVNPLLNESVLGVSNVPHAAVMDDGGVIVGKAGGLIVIILVLVIVLP